GRESETSRARSRASAGCRACAGVRSRSASRTSSGDRWAGEGAMSYEIRAMSLGEILDTGFRLVRDEFVPLVGIAATVQVPVAVLGAPTQKGGFFLPALFGLLILGLAGSPIVLAATTFAVGEVYLGRSITVGGSLRAAIGIILPLAGTMLLYYV